MSIEEFGTSLLADVRKRKDDQYQQYLREQRKADKRATKDARKQALIGVGLKAVSGVVSEMGNDFLRNKTEEFLNNSEHLNNSLTLQNATTMQTNAFKREKDLVDSGLDSQSFFATQALPQVEKIFAMNPEFSPAKYSTRQLDQIKKLAAGHLGGVLQEAHEKQHNAAQELAAGSINYKTYIEKTNEVAPTNFTRYAYGKIKGMLSEGGEDPVTSGLRLNGFLDKAEKKEAYFSIYKDSRDGFTAATIMEVLEDSGIALTDLGPPDTTYGKVISIDTPTTDMTGKVTTIKRSVVPVLANGIDTGVFVDAVTKKAIDSSIDPDPTNITDMSASQLSDEQSRIIQTQIVTNTDKEGKKVFDAAVALLVGNNTGGSPKEQQEINETARKVISGRILRSRNNLVKKHDMPSSVAYQVSVEAHKLRYENILKPADTLSFSSFITDEADFKKDIMPNKVHDSLAMYFGLELAQQKGLRVGIPNKQLLQVKKSLLNSVKESGFQTLSQRIHVLGVTDSEGNVTEKGLVDDPRFQHLNLREELLSATTSQQAPVNKPPLNGKIIPTEKEKEIFFENKDDPEFLLEYDKHFVRPENIEPKN